MFDYNFEDMPETLSIEDLEDLIGSPIDLE